MDILKRILGGLLAVLFQFLILLFPLLTALAMLLHSPQPLQQNLKDSGLYERVVPAILDQSSKQPGSGGEEGVQEALKDPKLQAAVTKAVSPEVLEGVSNQIIDGIFNWAQGKTPEPQFTIDLSVPRQSLLDSLKQFGLERASALKTCTAADLRATPPNPDLLNAPCLPLGVTPQAAADQFSQQAFKNTEFLNKASFTASDLPKDKDGQSITDKISWLPQAYHWLMIAPWAVGAMMTLAAIGVIFLSERWRGIRRIAICLLVTGILLLIGGVVQWLLFRPDRLSQAGVNLNLGNAELQSALLNMVAATLGIYARLIIIVGGIYTALGIGGLIGARKLRPDESVINMPTTIPGNHMELPKATEQKTESLVEKKK